MRILIARAGGAAGADRLLARYGHLVDMAYSASDAKRLIDELSPELVITGLLFDDEFPSRVGEDGLAVLISASARGIPCICMTSWASPVLRTCAQAGFSHVFLMPFDINQFLAAVEHVRQNLSLYPGERERGSRCV